MGRRVEAEAVLAGRGDELVLPELERAVPADQRCVRVDGTEQRAGRAHRGIPERGQELGQAVWGHTHVGVADGDQLAGGRGGESGVERAGLVASGRQVTLNHLDGVLGHAAAVFACAFPIAVRDFGNDLAAFFDGL